MDNNEERILEAQRQEFEARMTKEAIYDEQIYPLMAQIVEICRKHKIAMLADFALDAEGFAVSTFLLTPDFEPHLRQLQAWHILKPRS